MPSVFSHISSPRKRHGKAALNTFERASNTKRRRRENSDRSSAAKALLDLSVGDASDQSVETEVLSAPPVETGISVQTDLRGRDIDSLVSECQSLREKVYKLEKNSNYMLETGMMNPAKVNFYTGLPSFSILTILVNLVGPHLKRFNIHINSFQMVVLTLMRLRLNMSIQDLAYRFDVSMSTVSRVFRGVVDVLYVRLVPLTVKWPQRDIVFKTMPMSFRRKFKNCIVIIDCFKIFIERPSDLLARAQTWSNYKAHNTIKYLIGITPQGVISFISAGWGGRVSDKELTQSSAFLDKLLPGDLVLADRGFNIQELLALRGASLEIPAFTKGLSQLPAIDVETTREIANVRIHVERVIGLTRNKYTMLQDTIPITLLQKDSNSVPIVDKIVHVSCALVNLSSSVVPIQ